MRLLLVEDSERLQRSLSLGLKQAGYLVDISGDGRDALWRAGSVSYDVILLDIMIPAPDGLTVLKQLRQMGKDTHILLLTAKDTVEDRVNGLQAGADSYLINLFHSMNWVARYRRFAVAPMSKKLPNLSSVT